MEFAFPQKLRQVKLGEGKGSDPFSSEGYGPRPPGVYNRSLSWHPPWKAARRSVRTRPVVGGPEGSELRGQRGGHRRADRTGAATAWRPRAGGGRRERARVDPAAAQRSPGGLDRCGRRPRVACRGDRGGGRDADRRRGEDGSVEADRHRSGSDPVADDAVGAAGVSDPGCGGERLSADRPAPRGAGRPRGADARRSRRGARGRRKRRGIAERDARIAGRPVGPGGAAQ